MSQTPLPSSPPPPMPPPVRVLAFTEPAGRPGVITTLGVLSIVVGALSGVTAVVGGFFSAIFIMVTAMTPMMMSMQPGQTGGAIEFAGPNGFTTNDRTVILDAFAAKQGLSQVQQQQLEFLLADVGQKIVPAPAAGPSSNPWADYRAQNLTGAAGMNGDGSVWYTVPIGTITLTDLTSTFSPGAGSSTPAINRTRYRGNGTPNSTPLTAAEIQAVLDRVQEHAGPAPLSPAQIAQLQGELATNGAMIFGGAPADMADVLGQVVGVTPVGNGSILVNFVHANVIIDTTNGASTTPSFNAHPAGGTAVGRVKSPSTDSILIDAGLSVLLAILLLTAGIITLRNSLIARKLMLIFVAVKIPITLLTSLAVWSMFQTFRENLEGVSASGPAAVSTVAVVMMGIAAVFGLGYPLLVLLLLRTRSARDFYLVK